MMRDLFENHRTEDGGETYEQTRMMTKQLMEDRAFYDPCLRLIYEAGPQGMTMEKLARLGRERKWWQKTVGKHWGEKMRMLWAYGVLTVPELVGNNKLRHIRMIHPYFCTLAFHNPVIEADRARLHEALGRFDWMPQDMGVNGKPSGHSG